MILWTKKTNNFLTADVRALFIKSFDLMSNVLFDKYVIATLLLQY